MGTYYEHVVCLPSLTHECRGLKWTKDKKEFISIRDAANRGAFNLEKKLRGK